VKDDFPGRTQLNGQSPDVQGRLFRKYLMLIVTVIAVPLLANGAYEIWSTYQLHKASLIQLQKSQAEAAAGKIAQFIKEIENQVGWMTQLAVASPSLEQRRFDARLLLRQVPAIAEFIQTDGNGRERLHVSRLAMDVVDSGIDLSAEPKFTQAASGRVYYGPVNFRRESEPYMTLARGGVRRDTGVSIAEVNLKFIWDVVSLIKVGEKGRAYVVDSNGRLIAHPDISLVLRNTDLSALEQVRAARVATAAPPEQSQTASDVYGRPVLTAHAAIAPLDWHLFVELPFGEAYAPVYASLLATGLVLLAGLVLAAVSSLVLSRRMVRPIHQLQTGAAQIGAGALDHRIRIATGDELQALGEQFNSMAAQLEQSYATLERKVDERTKQLQLANLAKSRFLAAASHDLRQPLHALGLFVAQLRPKSDPAERTKIVARIDTAVSAMNELFNALLDISKLDAEVLTPALIKFPIAQVMRRVEPTFEAAAAAKGLSLRFVPSDAWVRSDFILLERILLNLVSNAVRYTERGGVVIGARRRGAHLRLEVWDTGSGIPEDQRENVFGEFYQLGGARGAGGLGLGLAIVDRLCDLLRHPIELTSRVGKGSRFAVLLPCVPAEDSAMVPPAGRTFDDACTGKVVVMIDDDVLVRDGMRGLLQGWGCEPVMADSADTALDLLARLGRRPDAIISDFRLQGGRTGIEAIARLRGVYGAGLPAFLVSGDTAPEPLRAATVSGNHLLHKPVQPIRLRALLSQVLKAGARRVPTGATDGPEVAASIPASPQR
jgi:signal transduction histidine kinase/CheY-like chemotaxis protein